MASRSDFPTNSITHLSPLLFLPPSFSQMMLKASLDAARPQPQPTGEARERGEERLFHTKSLISILVHAFVSFSYLEIDFLAHRISSHLISSHLTLKSSLLFLPRREETRWKRERRGHSDFRPSSDILKEREKGKGGRKKRRNTAARRRAENGN